MAKARANPAPVTIRRCCPVCGGDHLRDEHDLVGPALRALRTLTPPQLRSLRQDALEELAAAVAGGAEPEHVQRLAVLVARVTERLDADG